MRFFKVTEAYASFELDDDERALVAEAYEALADERGSGHATDADEEDPGTDVRCAEAAEWLRETYDTPERRLAAEYPTLAANDGTLRDAVERLLAVSDEATVHRLVEEYGEGYLASAVAEDELEALADRVRGGDPEERSTIRSTVETLENGGEEPLRPRTRFFDRSATDETFEALIEAVDGEKRVYEGHVDSFELGREEAEELAREVEVAHGGYGFLPPSSIYHRFMTGLTGGKMSSSVPASHISLLDDPADGYEKVKAATTAGRETAELQRELGGEADECPVYELYAYLLAGDDDEYATRVYDECYGGDRLCGDCKEEAAQLMREFLREHQEHRAELEPVLESMDVELDSSRKR
jgi:tryptophanyl-tRNA synthetase